MLVMRFSRVGRKNKPQFRIVLQEHTWAPTGKHVEILGNWDPNQKKGSFKNERIEYWLSKGVKASDTVHNLLISQEVIKGEKVKVKMSKKKGEEAEVTEEKKEDAGDKALTEENPKKEEKVETQSPTSDVPKEKSSETPKEEKVSENKEEKPVSDKEDKDEIKKEAKK